MIHVLALITTKPGERETVLARFGELTELVRAEAGCIEYGAAIDAAGFGSFQTPLGADSFFVVEKWESAAALQAHARAPHMAAYGAAVKEKLAGRTIHVLAPV